MAQSVNGSGPPPILAGESGAAADSHELGEAQGQQDLVKIRGRPPAVEEVRDAVGYEEGPIGKRDRKSVV